MSFRCPSCHARLALRWREGIPRCAECDWIAGTEEGVLDFVSLAARDDERAYYEEEYAGQAVDRGEAKSISSLARLWTDPLALDNRLLLHKLGDLRGKTVLLLGNGASEAELYFLTQRPEALVFSDLSLAAVQAIRSRYDLEDHARSVCFAAIDALALPLFDESVDIVYGAAFAHHLPDVARFIAEAARVVKPGGRGVFLDDAYAPLWHYSKQTWLRPLMLYTHRRQPISPEDLRFTMAGGFREAELARTIVAAGATPWFHRHSFLYYFWTRAADRLFPARLRFLRDRKGLATRLIWLDRRLARLRPVRRNLIRLVWGFDKPELPSASAP